MFVKCRIFKEISFFLVVLVSNFLQGESVIYPDFTVSMLREGRSSCVYKELVNKQMENSSYNMKYMDLFRDMYAKNVLLVKHSSKDGNYRIPRIIHQIWLGKGDIPVKYLGWMKTWKNWLGWEYKLWTDDDVKYFNLYNQKLYDNASNLAEKSDILRLEILLRYGGLYVDVDSECIKPYVFDELNKCLDLYMGFEPIEHGILDEYNMPKICNALIAVTADHPLIKHLIVNMEENCTTVQDLWTVEKTGPAYITRELFAYELNNQDTNMINMYFPCTFFYPFSEPEIWYMENYRDADFKRSGEVASIHYWGGSWKK